MQTPLIKVGKVCRDEGAGEFYMRGTYATTNIKVRCHRVPLGVEMIDVSFGIRARDFRCLMNTLTTARAPCSLATEFRLRAVQHHQ